MHKLEIIVETIHDAITAESNGASQLDLKANYANGGVTTSAGTIEMICQQISIPVLVMIHPYTPSFCYSKNDLKIIKRDIQFARQLGANHFLIGSINSKREIDLNALHHIQEAAENAYLHFNLVWQLTTHPLNSLDILMEHNITSIRSSGTGFLGDKAEHYLPELKQIHTHIHGHMELFAAGGVNAANLELLIKKTRVSHFHTGSGARNPYDPFGPVIGKMVKQMRLILDSLN